MAQGFARLYRRFWADEKVGSLAPEEKLVAAYLLTGQSNRIGLFRFSVGMAEDDTGIPRKRLDTLLDRVCETLSWEYDRPRGVVWIKSWWRWNPPPNEKAFIGYLKDAADIPNTRLLADFRNHRSTLSDTLFDILCRRVSMPEPMPEPEPKPYPEPEEKTHPSSTHVEGHAVNGSAESNGHTNGNGQLTVKQWFLTVFWPRYPRKVGKIEAYRRVRVLFRDAGPEREDDLGNGIMDRLHGFKTGEWADRTPDKIPHPATFLNREDFLDA